MAIAYFAHQAYITVRGADDGIKPGVSPRTGRGKWNRARGAGDSGFRNRSFHGHQLARPWLSHDCRPLRGLTSILMAYLGFRCAPLQALCRRPLRGLLKKGATILTNRRTL